MCTALLQQELTWPLMPLSVHVTSTCDLWACFEESVHLCHTWDMVLACTGVFTRAPQVSFCVSEAQPLSWQSSIAEDTVPVLSLGTACPEHFRLAGGTQGYRTARAQPLPDGISLNFSEHTEVCIHGWEPVLECAACMTPSVGSVTESRGVLCHAIGTTSLWPKGWRVRARLFLELEKEPDRP